MFSRSDRGLDWRSTACLCICHYVAGPCDDVVCSRSATASAVPPQLVTAPRAPLVAASHHTARTLPISTPLGVSQRFSR
jgi:hypothetical protein